MLTFFSVLEGALDYLEIDQGISADEVHEVDIELYGMFSQGAVVRFPEHNYMCFTYNNWRKGDFIGYRINESDQ